MWREIMDCRMLHFRLVMILLWRMLQRNVFNQIVRGRSVALMQARTALDCLQPKQLTCLGLDRSCTGFRPERREAQRFESG